MNHYKARQKQVSKVWHYTCANNDDVYPVGYCADNCPGHSTEDEAIDHYKQYLLDEARFTDPKDDNLWPKYKCDIKDCVNHGSVSVSVGGYSHYNLCQDHANKDNLATLVKVYESWGS